MGEYELSDVNRADLRPPKSAVRVLDPERLRRRVPGGSRELRRLRSILALVCWRAFGVMQRDPPCLSVRPRVLTLTRTTDAVAFDGR